MTTTINREELVGRLLGTDRATFAAMTTVTDARCRKTLPVEPDSRLPATYSETKITPPFPLPATKECRVNACLCFQYAAGIRRRLAKEGKDPESFTSGTCWHKPVIEGGKVTPLCTHKDRLDELYVWYMPLKVVGEITYRDALGRPLAPEVIKPWLPAKKENTNQGLDEPVPYRIVKLANVKNITLNGVTYTVTAK